jgi:hypothetical protein
MGRSTARNRSNRMRKQKIKKTLRRQRQRQETAQPKQSG